MAHIVLTEFISQHYSGGFRTGQKDNQHLDSFQKTFDTEWLRQNMWNYKGVALIPSPWGNRELAFVLPNTALSYDYVMDMIEQAEK